VNIPRYTRALLQALQLTNAGYQDLANLSDAEWEKLLALSDSSQLTLLFGHCTGEELPAKIRQRIGKNQIDNAQRLERLKNSLVQIVKCLNARGIDFCVIKGFSHSPDFTPDPLLRAQGDIDLWHLPSEIDAAQQALVSLGYRPFGKSKGRHRDPLIHEREWQFEWRGDYYAPELPIPVDLHFELWDEAFEFLPGPNEREWWERRVSKPFQGATIHHLTAGDALTFAVLHFMMHLFHGDPRLQRGWEIAHFLHHRSGDEAFWVQWEKNSSPRLLHLQAAAFELSRLWFGCDLPPVATTLISNLPPDIVFWLQRYGLSPIESLFVPNKDELWLNLCFVESYKHRLQLLFRRLLPKPDSSGAEGIGKVNHGDFWVGRIRHHLRTFPITCLRGIAWYGTYAFHTLFPAIAPAKRDTARVNRGHAGRNDRAAL
jgi:putative nucleotidyltransferase-like protein